MTIRLSCDVDDTKELMVAILRTCAAGHRVMFLDEASRGGPKMQAVRVRLSRLRKAHRDSGKKQKHFSLHHSIHPHTEGGKRHDCVVVWMTRSERHRMTETLEDLVGHSNEI
jgi:nucleoside-triphosphatase THEP1